MLPLQATSPSPQAEPASTRGIPPLLRSALGESLRLFALATAGLVLRITVASVDPEVFGEMRASVFGVVGYTSWILMGTYAGGRATMYTLERHRTRQRLVDEMSAVIEAEEECEANAVVDQIEAVAETQQDVQVIVCSPLDETTVVQATTPKLERGRAARAKRRATGLPEEVLNREDLFTRLETELEISQREEEWLGLILVKFEQQPSSEEDELRFQDPADVRAAAGQATLEELRATDFLGHVGDGLFVAGLPRTNVREGRIPEARLRERLGQLALDFGCRLTTSFVTSHVDDTVEKLYSRAILAMSTVRPATAKSNLRATA